MINRIIFVCTGNTCRSPMAEAILKDMIHKNQIEGIEVLSRGLKVYDKEINAKALLSLNKLGIKEFSHTPRELSEEEIKTSDLVLTMTKSHKDYINQNKSYPNVLSIAEYLNGSDIPDPYGLDEETYDKVAGIIYDSCLKILNKIKQGENKWVKYTYLITH